jgi:hypothetical protein
MDTITDKIESLHLIDKNKCICCKNNYIIEYDNQYTFNDKLCIICYNNYIDFMTS